MILRKVRESAYEILNPVNPVLIQCVRTDFHHDKLNTLVAHKPEHTLKLNAFRCGAVGGDDSVADKVSNRADQSDFIARLFGDRFYHVCCCRFSVRAGDADDRDSVKRMTVKLNCKFGHCMTCVFHNNLRHRKRKLPFNKERGCAAGNCAFGKFVPVFESAADAAKQLTAGEFS